MGKFLTWAAGILASVITIFIGWLFTVGGFVTHAAYADDQAKLALDAQKLDQIIALISKSSKTSVYHVKRSVLNQEIKQARREILFLEDYLRADPNSKLKDARESRIGRLATEITNAESKLKTLEEERDMELEPETGG